jgi:hypothetical protein
MKFSIVFFRKINPSMMLGIYTQTTAQAGRDLNFTSAKIHSVLKI